MHFLRDTAVQAIAGQTITVVIPSNSEAVETITARAFLAEGKLFIDCVPAVPGKYTEAVPLNAIICFADRPDKNWKYGIFPRPDSEARRLVRRLSATRAVSNN